MAAPTPPSPEFRPGFQPATPGPHRCVVGLWDGHDAGAALIVDEVLRAAVSEERLTRRKGQGGFPHRALQTVLQLGGVAAADVDQVAVAGRYGRAPARTLDQRYAAADPAEIDPLAWDSRLFAQYQHQVAHLPGLRAAEAWLGRRALRGRLAEQGLESAPCTLVDHHEAHAWAARARVTLPALIVTLDGYGDGLSGAVWRADERGLTRLQTQGPADSLGLLYGGVNRLLGFREGEEGKVTGLATRLPRGSARLDLTPFVAVQQGHLAVQRKAALAAVRRALAAGLTREEVALAVQEPVEQAVLSLVQHHLAQTGLTRLAVAGGVFANVAIGGRLAALDLAELSICPAMGDQGLCVGAALAVMGNQAEPRTVWPTLRLGPEIASSHPPPPDLVAQRLAQGSVVAVAQGRLEFGPRALGARSILMDPRDPKAADRLNERLQRSPFMPLAPVLAAERWEEVFALPRSRIPRSAGDMVLALPAAQAFVGQAPAAVAPDGTARPQALERTEDPWLHAVLEAFTARTGCPALVNTSFNRHGEPIVCTAAEALASARAAGLDAVVIGDELVA